MRLRIHQATIVKYCIICRNVALIYILYFFLQGCQLIGKPECDVLLAQATVHLARLAWLNSMKLGKAHKKISYSFFLHFLHFLFYKLVVDL